MNYRLHLLSLGVVASSSLFATVASVAKAEPMPKKAYAVALKELKAHGNPQRARFAGLKIWIEEVENGQYPPGPVLNNELRLFYGRNAKQFDLTTGQLIDPQAMQQDAAALSMEARARQAAQDLQGDLPPTDTGNPFGPGGVVVIDQAVDVDVVASPARDARIDHASELAEAATQGLKSWSKSNGETFKGRYWYKWLNPSTNNWEFTFLGEKDEWITVPQSKFPPETLIVLLRARGQNRSSLSSGWVATEPGTAPAAIRQNTEAQAFACLGKTLKECSKKFGQPTNTNAAKNFVDFAATNGVGIRCFFGEVAADSRCDGVLFEPVQPGERVNDLLNQNSQGQRWNGPEQRSNDVERFLLWKRDDGAAATLHEVGIFVINSPQRAREMGL